MDALWILALLIAISGYFALAEMALASARRSRLHPLAEDGDLRATQALAIKDRPSRLLAATQTGVTAAALLSGVFGESALKEVFADWVLRWLPFAAAIKEEIALTATIALVTAVSIVFGEIVPKRIAIAHPEKVAMVCAPSMTLFIRLISPAIHLLSWSADMVLRALPVRAAPAVISVEDILAYVDEGQRAGEIAPEESHLLGNVFRLEDRRVAAIMTPAAGVAYLDLLRPREHNLGVLRESPHAQMPICKGHLQHAIGVVESHDILQAALAGELDFAELPMTPPRFVPGSLTLIELLRTLHAQRINFAFVVNEFGQTEGIVTLDDLLKTVVGDMMPFADDPEAALAVRRADGSWLLDGLLPVDEMKGKLDLREIPDEDFGNFHTVGGFVLSALGRIPKKGESFDYAGWRFEVVDVERNRVDEVLASPLPAEHPGHNPL
jgi:putative hemolysin